MARSRARAVARLTALIGGPLLLVTTLFGGGVYLGIAHRPTVMRIERDWLFMNVEVPPQPEPKKVEEPKEPDPDSNRDKDREKDAAPQPASPVAAGDGGGNVVSAAPQPVPQVGGAPIPNPVTAGQTTSINPTAQVPNTATANQPSAPQPSAPTQPAPASPPSTTAVPLSGTPTSPAAAVNGDLAALLNVPVTVQIKVLVDPEVVSAQADWIDYVQRTVSSASQIYREQFGIQLELHGVGRWAIATAGMDVAALLADLSQRPREGADVLIGLTSRPLDGMISGRAETPLADSPFNGANAVIYAMPGNPPQPHLRTLLHEVAHLFGALDITDAKHPDWQAGSWMSYAPVRPGQAPWIDQANRQRVLQRKSRPFSPEGRN